MGCAIATRLADIDSAAALKSEPVQHQARVSPLELPQLLRDIDAYEGDAVTRLALQFMTLTFVRTTEMIQARWGEIDEAKAEWRIPAERMKMRDPHIVPLSTQALAVLAELREITGHRDFLFYSPRGKTGHISNNTMLSLCAVSHGIPLTDDRARLPWGGLDRAQ